MLDRLVLALYPSTILQYVHLAHVGWACTGFVPQYNYEHLAVLDGLVLALYPCSILCTSSPCWMGLYWLCTPVQFYVHLAHVGWACTGFVPQYNYVYLACVGWACTGFVLQ